MRAIRRRLPWLGLNLLTTSLSASVIGLFQGTIQSMALAAALMTIVAAQGGNAGVQTLTVMVRGMALGKISMAQARSILLKELAVACGNGVALGIAAGVVTYVLHGQALLATVLGIALAVNFLVAALVGSLIPLMLRWLRADPAVASSVFVTACTDMCGFLVVPRPAVAGPAAIRCGLRATRSASASAPASASSRAIDVEDLVHPDQLEERPHRLGHRAELQVASLGVQLTEAGQDRAKARAVDEAQLAQIEDHLAARLEQRARCRA